MDVFGNSLYIPNQAGWAQTSYMPSSNAFTATNTTNTWSQTPPSNIPWGISYSQTLPNVIRFTGQSDMNFPHQSSISSPCSSIKRRFDDSDEYLSDGASYPSNKQFITEERMTAKMNNMHISNAFVALSQNSGPQNTSNSSNQHNFQIEELDDDGMLSEAGNNNNDRMPSLYISEELKQLKSCIEPFIPQAMLPRQINSKALMLWTPRVDLFAESTTDASDENSEFIRSDDPKCNVVITEITDQLSSRGVDDEMSMEL